MAETLIGSTFDGGRYRVDKHLQGEGLRQLYLGSDAATTDAVLISYDKLPKYTTIEDFIAANKAPVPGVLDLLFAGTPDGEPSYWGVIERVPQNARWMPDVLGRHPPHTVTDSVPKRLPSFEPGGAVARALAFGRSAGRILADSAARGAILARVRPETMWITGDRVVGLSQRSELMFSASWVTAFSMPVFDRYYYAPEVGRNQHVDDRALVFSLSIMIAEWATGLYPFAKKSFDGGPTENQQVALDLPPQLAALLGAGMNVSVAMRPSLAAFLAELERCVDPSAK